MSERGEHRLPFVRLHRLHLQLSQGFKMHTESITTTTQRGDNTKAWHLLRCPFPQEDAISLLVQRTGIDPSLMLTDNKLPPDVSAVIPLSIADHMDTSGQTIYFPTFTWLTVARGIKAPECSMNSIFAE